MAFPRESPRGYFLFVLKLLNLLRLSDEKGATELWWRSFGFPITVLLLTTFLVSNGNNSRLQFRALCCQWRHADKVASCPWQQHKLKSWTLKIGHQTFVAPYSADYRNTFSSLFCASVRKIKCLALRKSCQKVFPITSQTFIINCLSHNKVCNISLTSQTTDQQQQKNDHAKWNSKMEMVLDRF